MALAEDQPRPTLDLQAWEVIAGQAEATLTADTATQADLEALRSTISAQRDQFQQVLAPGNDRIAILREQIDALGPAPADGASEAVEVAERRASLNAQLAEAQAPLVTAQEATRRAEAIIRTIDREIRERQADALLEHWPTPLNPVNWPAAAQAVLTTAQSIVNETTTAWAAPATRAELTSRLPLILGALALSLLLLTRARPFTELLAARFLGAAAPLPTAASVATSLAGGTGSGPAIAGAGSAGLASPGPGALGTRRWRVLAGFFISLLQILVAVAGLGLFGLAVTYSGLAGPTLLLLIGGLLYAGVVLAFARWLSLQLFPLAEDPGTALHMNPDARRKARIAALWLALAWSVQKLVTGLFPVETHRLAALAVLLLPVFLFAGFAMVQAGRALLLHNARPALDPDGQPTGGTAPSFFDRLVLLLAQILIGLGLVAPLFALIGYVSGASQLLFPAMASLGLIGLLMALQRAFTAFYDAISGTGDGAADALVPALVGFVLALLAIPFIALIWGARETELFEIWQRFSAGFSFGTTRISPANLLFFLLIFAVGYLLTRGVQGALSSSVLPRTKLDKGAQKAINSGIGYFGIVAAALIAFSAAGIDLSGLAIVAGALSVGIGFGLQNIVSNFVSGIILLIERPVSEGDLVEVGATQGVVSRISVRSTIIETGDKAEVIVPNSNLISSPVTNFTKSNRTGRVVLPVGVAYGSDTRHVEAVLREIVESHPVVAIRPRPSVMFEAFGENDLKFVVRAVLRDVNLRGSVASDLNHAIAARFREEGIEMPFPQRDLWIRNPEAFAPQPASSAPKPAAEPDGAVLPGGGIGAARPPEFPLTRPTRYPGATTASELDNESDAGADPEEKQS